jgi:hypothetical protein
MFEVQCLRDAVPGEGVVSDLIEVRSEEYHITLIWPSFVK